MWHRYVAAKKVGDVKTSKDEAVLDLDVRWCGDPTVVLNVVFMGRVVCSFA